jgi:hypothetical protein
MSATDNPRIMRANTPGGSPEMEEVEEGASETFKSFQFVYLDSAGQLAAKASDAGDVAYIWGICRQDATGTTATKLLTEKIGVDDLVEITYTDATGLLTPVKGKGYGLVVSSNKCKLDIDEVTTKYFVVDKVLDTTTKRCLVKLIPATIQGLVGS